MIEETITALATPPGKSGVAIVRISGELSHEILKKITQSSDDFLPRKMYFKNIFLDGFSDNALVVYFKAPYSFTGEDVAEIQCHGGYYLALEVIKKVTSFGARMALPGEFSKRAFLNGKMSIDQAEGIMDMINAETSEQAKAGSVLIRGELFEKIDSLQNKLTDCLASIEAKLDYPEYDFDEFEMKNIKTDLQDVQTELKKLLDTRFKGSLIKNGVKVAIVGEPNVGKSSLLNALTHSNKAIVTSVAGTTRDVVEAEYVYNGVIFRLFDTAGIRESDDIVEKIGIERAKNILNEADIVLKLQEVGKNFDLAIDSNNILNVFTKTDLHNNVDMSDEKCIYISSNTNKNIEELKKRIFDLTVKSVGGGELSLTNARHIDCVSMAVDLLGSSIDGLDTKTLDFVVSDINLAWQKLGEITGKTSNEEIIDRVFEKFCLGK